VDRDTTRMMVGAVLLVAVIAGGLTVLRQRQVDEGLDFTERLAFALESARERVADAELSGAQVSYVDSGGRVELPVTHALLEKKQPPSGPTEGITFRFRSESRAASRAQPPEALGRPVALGSSTPSCVIQVQTRNGKSLAASDTVRVHELPEAQCGRSSAAPVKCTLAQVWAKALTQGAPKEALAQIELELDRDAHWVWKFEVFDWSKGPAGMNVPAFSAIVPDDC
jgi:hypothetical protein